MDDVATLTRSNSSHRLYAEHLPTANQNRLHFPSCWCMSIYMNSKERHARRIAAKELRDRGYTYEKIAQQLEVSTATVANDLKALNENAPTGISTTNLPRDTLRWYGITPLRWPDIEEVWVNAFDISEIALKAKGMYYDWYGRHTTLLRCYEADAQDYGIDSPFVPLPIGCLWSIAQAYIYLAEQFEWLFEFENDAYELTFTPQERLELLGIEDHPAETDYMFCMRWALRTGQLLRELLPPPDHEEHRPDFEYFQTTGCPLLASPSPSNDTDHNRISNRSASHITSLATLLQLEYTEFQPLLQKLLAHSAPSDSTAGNPKTQQLAALGIAYAERLKSLDAFQQQLDEHYDSPLNWALRRDSAPAWTVVINGFELGKLYFDGDADEVDPDTNCWACEPCDGAAVESHYQTENISQLEATYRLHQTWSRYAATCCDPAQALQRVSC